MRAPEFLVCWAILGLLTVPARSADVDLVSLAQGGMNSFDVYHNWSDQDLELLGKHQEIRRLFIVFNHRMGQARPEDVPKVTDAGIAHLARLFEVRDLRLEFRPGLTDLSLKHLRGLTNLTTLGFYGSRITDNGLEYASSLTELRYFMIGSSLVTDKGLPSIARLSKLTSLDLQLAKVTDDGLPHLAGLTNLTWLCLQKTAITGAGLKHLSGLTNLNWFIAEGTAVDDSGLPHLAGMHKLTTLYLSWTKVTGAGLKHLSHLPKLERLRLNALNSAGVDDAGLAALIPIKTLREIELFGHHCTEQGVKSFQVARPDVQIILNRNY